MMRVLRLESADSTNTWVAENEGSLTSPSLVYAVTQRAGRGQRGNSWESEPGKNITASLIFHPENFPACSQFQISEAVALALIDYLKSKGVDAKVKWPNDIYAGDKKICGILMEHVVMGKNISRTIAGFGINLNQEEFISDAPNPVSLIQLTGKPYVLEKEVDEVASFLENRITGITEKEIHSEFCRNLWRHDGCLYKFLDRKRNEKIEAEIESVGQDGILTLKISGGEKREYAFKEIEFVL